MIQELGLNFIKDLLKISMGFMIGIVYSVGVYSIGLKKLFFEMNPIINILAGLAFIVVFFYFLNVFFQFYLHRKIKVSF